MLSRATCLAIALIGVFAAATMWAGDSAPRENPDSDQRAIQGKWIVIHNELAQQVLKETHGNRFAFEGERFRINGELAGERFVLGPENEPKTIDFMNGPSVIKGIYKLEADRLTLCTAPPQTPRPGRFETDVASRVILTVLRRGE